MGNILAEQVAIRAKPQARACGGDRGDDGLLHYVGRRGAQLDHIHLGGFLRCGQGENGISVQRRMRGANGARNPVVGRHGEALGLGGGDGGIGKHGANRRIQLRRGVRQVAVGVRVDRRAARRAVEATCVRVDDLADHLALSVRTTQRLADRYIGLTPLAIIRRYRLQEAAERLRSDPAVTIADVAADLAYTDHAHFSADFKRTLGFAPSEYRRRV